MEVITALRIIAVHPEATIEVIIARTRVFESPSGFESLVRSPRGLSTGRTNG
jgi:hypothetical protein